MNKKLQLFGLIIFTTFYFNGRAQEQQNTCGSLLPPQQWEEWFSKAVENYKEQAKTGKTQLVQYTIPVVVHVIHFGETVGTYPNVDSNQIKSQIVVLNNDFAGMGLGTNGVPLEFSNLIANTGIRFCLATKTPSGGTMGERGIDRVNALANSWTNPNTAALNLQNYLNTIIIPATIWDPTKYLNIWISDKNANKNYVGFATYPSGTNITGLFNGPMGTVGNDGIWCYTKAFGTIGVVAPHDKGRTATHELGHWLGLRHIWGDGNCLSDYVGDTPTPKYPHYGCPTSSQIDACGVNTAPNGEMYMNFMDRTDDPCMYMFTPDQNFRIQTAMSQCPNRNLLGTHGLCTPQPSPPTSSAVSSFVLGADQCVGTPFSPFNTSSGFPNPTYIWSSSPASNIYPFASVANPAFTFNNPGTYTITLVATNSLATSTSSMIVTATGSCAAYNLCLDSLKMIKNVDTLKTYAVPNSSLILPCASGFVGWMAGTNCYGDKEFAQFFPPNTYTSTYYPQVNSAIVLFNTKGTVANNAATQVYCKVYAGNGQTGPGSPIGIPNTGKGDSIGKIVLIPPTSSVGYLGKPNYVLSNNIYAHRFDFQQPVIINNNSGFFVSVKVPGTTLDSINIYTNTKYNTAVDSSAWYQQSNGNWRTFRFNRSAKVQLAIIPQITCSQITGVQENKQSLAYNVNIMPNPSNGIFSLVFTLPSQQELNIRIYNSLGQLVDTNTLKQIGSGVVDVDLSAHGTGVYYAELSNGTEKTVKKIVIAN